MQTAAAAAKDDKERTRAVVPSLTSWRRRLISGCRCRVRIQSIDALISLLCFVHRLVYRLDPCFLVSIASVLLLSAELPVTRGVAKKNKETFSQKSSK
jgi:hypothetical protein